MGSRRNRTGRHDVECRLAGSLLFHGVFNDGIGSGRSFFGIDDIFNRFKMVDGLLGESPAFQAAIFDQDNGLLSRVASALYNGIPFGASQRAEDAFDGLVVEFNRLGALMGNAIGSEPKQLGIQLVFSSARVEPRFGVFRFEKTTNGVAGMSLLAHRKPLVSQSVRVGHDSSAHRD